jgi:NADP-reducing hydrogenase subunit HndB
MQDLAQAREQALELQRADANKYRHYIRIGMASCSIAAGANDTLQAIKHQIAAESIPGVSADQICITQVGCLGLCSLEPIVQIQVADQPLVTYGKVTPAVAYLILRDHIGKGLIAQEHVIQNI